MLLAGGVTAQTWQVAPRCPINASTLLLLRDGRVLAHAGGTTNIALLTPDNFGSYSNGTWRLAASLPAGYAPFNYSSAVLPDGRVLFEGGEYIGGGHEVWSNLGAVYDPKADVWTPVAPPVNWNYIGDGPSVLLPNGVYMQASCCSHIYQTALLNAATMTWTEGPNSKIVNFGEQGWTLLPSGDVLSANNKTACGTDKGSQVYRTATNTWDCGPELADLLYKVGPDNGELGSTVLTYNGKVLQVSGNDVIGTDIYDVASNTWSTGPTPPVGYNQNDSPSVLEPNGLVLMVMWNSNPLSGDCQMFEFDPVAVTLTASPNPPECPYGGAGLNSRMIPLPNGQILLADFARVLELYTPAPGIVAAAAPMGFPTSPLLHSGSQNNVMYGRQLNGLSQGVFYGDDYQGATNYPIVTLSDGAGHEWFAITHGDSYSGIAPGVVSYTRFDLPSMPAGAYVMSITTNGIKGNPMPVLVK
jgi:hypothetical protein